MRRILIFGLGALLIGQVVLLASGLRSTPKEAAGDFHVISAQFSFAELTERVPLVIDGFVLSKTSDSYASRSDLKNPLTSGEQRLVDGGLDYTEWTVRVDATLKGSAPSSLAVRQDLTASAAAPIESGKSYRFWLEPGSSFTTTSYYIPNERLDLPVTSLLSLTTSGGLGNDFSAGPVLSSDGGRLAFFSYATNLVPEDTNSRPDVFLREAGLGTTSLVSRNDAGLPGNGGSFEPSISQDGVRVAFWSAASNLVTGDTNGVTDVFLRDTAVGTTTRVSKSASGVEGNGGSSSPSISGDGKFVAFASSANNLIVDDTNGKQDIFVAEPESQTMSRVSLGPMGSQGNGDSRSPSISGDGRFVVFESDSSNLVTGDTNGRTDVFLRDMQEGTTTLISQTLVGGVGNGLSLEPAISGSGRFVAFSSFASDIIATDTNATRDVFVRDTSTGVTTLLSVDSSGIQGLGDSWQPYISYDGRFVAFTSKAANLIAGDTNLSPDIFLRDQRTNTTRRVSVDSLGTQSSAGSYEAAICADGRYVAFKSDASNLVVGDTNSVADIVRRGTV